MRILYMEQSHHKEPAKFYGPPGPYEAVDPVGSLDPYMVVYPVDEAAVEPASRLSVLFCSRSCSLS